MQNDQEEPAQPSQLKKPKHQDSFFANSGSPLPSRHAPTLTKANRRLDSLARLLEGGMICASVYLTAEGIVYVTTNTIYPNKKNFPPNAKIKYLQEIFLHFRSDEYIKSSANEITEDDVRIIIKIYLEKLNADYQANVKLMPQIEEAILRKMIIYFSKEREGWMRSYNIEMHSEFLNVEDNAFFSNKDALNSQQHMKLNKKLAVIGQVLNLLWGHFRDYSKFKSLTTEPSFLLNDFRILAIGNEKEHAELRMLSYLLSESQILIN
jgi:hypothetical protein